jgi:hypothetical protein
MLEARAGFEPANDGFANRCLSQLGDRASCVTSELSEQLGHSRANNTPLILVSCGRENINITRVVHL